MCGTGNLQSNTGNRDERWPKMNFLLVTQKRKWRDSTLGDMRSWIRVDEGRKAVPFSRYKKTRTVVGKREKTLRVKLRLGKDMKDEIANMI